MAIKKDKRIAILMHTTFCREKHAQRTIESFRNNPSYKLYIADTGTITPEKIKFYDKLIKDGHEAHLFGFDVSPATTRNFLIDRITEPYVWKIDDDFEDRGEVNINGLISLLESDDELGFVGMSVYSTKYRSSFIYNIEIKDGKAKKIPIENPELLNHKNCLYYYSDVTPDCWIAKRSVFPLCGYDERYNVGEGLHTDFFMHIKYNTPYRVAYTINNMMYTFKHEDEWEMDNQERLDSFYYSKRFRKGRTMGEIDFSNFNNKWGVNGMEIC